MNLPTYSHAESRAETYDRPRLDIFQYQDSPTSVDLRWCGGYSVGGDIACAIIAGCGLNNIALVINHAAIAEASATLGVSGADTIAAIKRCTAAKAERAAA